jgi:hypothetical protein
MPQRTSKQEIEQQMALPLDVLDEIGQSYGPTRKQAPSSSGKSRRSDDPESGKVLLSFGSSMQNVGNPPMHLPL